ncbi:MAG: phytanoyl-CoA dioxygenase family protein [Chloroflexota bacterium]|nr:phytanoyl-CoA dioxygenase family protein [Chloroflexota bacterium]
MVAAPETVDGTVDRAESRPRIVSRGQELEQTPESFGELRRSDDLVRSATGEADVAKHAPALRQRIVEDGYVYLPGYLDREEVLGARRELCGQLAGLGLLDTSKPLEEAALNAHDPDAPFTTRPAALARQNRAIQRLLYARDGRMIRFYEAFLAESVRHYDFTWLRIVRPGKGTASHCDIVFMGRGTADLYTSWTPLGDIDRRLGGLIVLEGSHRKGDLKDTYCQTDVDTYCENRFDGAWLDPQGTRNRPELATGAITEDHVGLRRQMGGRWLTADFAAGDLLVFGMYLVHASLDNQTPDRVRLSSDSRYQRASEPADERWVGAEPPGHGPQSGRGVIC